MNLGIDGIAIETEPPGGEDGEGRSSHQLEIAGWRRLQGRSGVKTGELPVLECRHGYQQPLFWRLL